MRAAAGGQLDLVGSFDHGHDRVWVSLFGQQVIGSFVILQELCQCLAREACSSSFFVICWRTLAIGLFVDHHKMSFATSAYRLLGGGR